MKIIVGLLLIALMLSSCGMFYVQNSGEDVDIPYFTGDTYEMNGETHFLETDVKATGDEVGDEETERKYHISLGMKVVEDIGAEAGKIYDLEAYDGAYAYLRDSLYRAKLDIDIWRAKGYDDGTYNEIYAKICAFIEKNEPEYLHSQVWGKEDKSVMVSGWVGKLFAAATLDEKQIVENKELMEVLGAYFHKNSLSPGYSGNGISKDKYPMIYNELCGKAISTNGQEYDEKTARTRVKISFSENTGDIGGYFVYLKGGTQIKNLTMLLNIAKTEKDILISPNYSGKISIAHVSKHGILGETVVYNVSSEAKAFTDDEVKFLSPSLEKALRKHLNKNEGDIITNKELLEINDIFINGEYIVFNREGLTLDVINYTGNIRENDLSFSDFDNFPFLDSLVIKNNQMEAPSGKTVCNVSFLELANCGINDISGLENALVNSLDLSNNDISDASVIETMVCLDSITLKDNPIEKLEMPKKAITAIDIRGALLDNCDFLKECTSVYSFNCENTEITDIFLLLRFKQLYSLSLPEKVDIAVVEKIETLKVLYIGGKSIIDSNL